MLGALDPRQAELLLLRGSGLSYAELAAALELNPASVGTLLSRAQQAFRKEYINDMENNEMHDQWVDRRLAALDPPQTWQPDATLGLARFRARQKAYRIRQTRWTWAAVAASVTAVGLFLLAPAPCSGAGCSKTAALTVREVACTARPTRRARNGRAGSQAAPAPSNRRAARAPARNFKESGSVLAPITAELYTDYECPHCATVFLQTIPGFVARLREDRQSETDPSRFPAGDAPAREARRALRQRRRRVGILRHRGQPDLSHASPLGRLRRHRHAGGSGAAARRHGQSAQPGAERRAPGRYRGRRRGRRTAGPD